MKGYVDVAELSREVDSITASDAVDAELAASGDTHAFERLYRNHVGRIHNLARRMVGPDDADEAAQDVFVRAWEKLHLFRGESAFGTWLHRVAINVMLGKRQAMGISRERMHDGEGVFETLASRPAQTELGMDFEVAIAKLPEGARRVFVLHDVEGFKHHEVAELLGITSGTSKAQLHRARMALRQHLDR